MANQWFRMYSEFATDAKVQSMSEAMQRRLTMLLCLRCSDVLATLQDDELQCAMRISDEDLAETKALFMRKGFIDGDWNLLNWDKRQFNSDSSTERSRKHREAKKAANAAIATSRNVAATPPDTDTDTDTPNGVQGGEPPASTDATPYGDAAAPPAKPNAGDKKIELPDWMPAEPWANFVAMRRAKGKRSPFTVAAAKMVVAELGSLREQGHDAADVLNQSLINGWSGVFAIKSPGRAVAPANGAIGVFV